MALEFMSALRSFLHCGYDREVSKKQFINSESLLVPSSDSEDGASRSASVCCDVCGLFAKSLSGAGLLHLRNMKKLNTRELMPVHLLTWSAKGPKE